MPIYLKIASVMATFVFLVNALFVFVAYHNYEKILNEIIQSRFIIVGDHVENTISAGLKLGLNLKELQSAQKIIDDTKAGDPEILSIQIFELIDGTLGKTVFSTRKAGIGTSVPSNWVRVMLGTEKGKIWHIYDDGVNLLGKTVYNMFDAAVGAIVVRFTEDYTQHKLQVVLDRLTLLLGTFTIFISIFLFFLCFFITRSFTHSLRRMTGVMRKILLEEQHVAVFIPLNPVEEHLSGTLEKSIEVHEQLCSLKKQVISFQEKKHDQ